MPRWRSSWWPPRSDAERRSRVKTAADAPGRHEPGTGEIAFPRVYQALEQAGYTGFVSYELFPARSTAEAVAAIRASG